MNPTSGPSNAPLHGVIVGPLRELYPDRIVVADRILFLRDGQACRYTVGVVIEVVYTEVNGRASVQKIGLAGRTG